MTSTPPRSRALWAAVAAAGLLTSCTSRTLPLPPPTDSEATALTDEPGMARVTGLAFEGASVGVLNEETQRGAITTSDEIDCGRACPFEVTIEAGEGDAVRVWQFFETPDADHIDVE